MILELCENIRQLDSEINELVGTNNEKDKYIFLAKYMKLKGATYPSIVDYHYKYQYLMESFLSGNWRNCK